MMRAPDATLGQQSELGQKMADVLRVSAAVGVTAASLVAIDGWLGRRWWPSSATELIGPAGATEAMLTFSGLGSTDGAQHAEDIARVYPIPGAYWNYSSSTFSVSALSVLLRERMPNLRHIGLNGHSMGGPAGLEAIPRAALPDAKLGPIVLHCSPFDYTDGRNHKLARLLDFARVPTGPGSKMAFSLIRGMLEGTPPWLSWSEALTNATTGCSPRLWLEQLRALRAINLNERCSDLARMVGDGTYAVYCRPANPEMDRTVDTVRASERYGKFFESLRIPYEIIQIPNAGHADVRKACGQLALRTHNNSTTKPASQN